MSRVVFVGYHESGGGQSQIVMIMGLIRRDGNESNYRYDEKIICSFGR